MHDTLLQIQNAGSAIRRPLKVQFIGEEGVDEGGVQKVHTSPEAFHVMHKAFSVSLHAIIA